MNKFAKAFDRIMTETVIVENEAVKAVKKAFSVSSLGEDEKNAPTGELKKALKDANVSKTSSARIIELLSVLSLIHI